jgi:hypothetical protein
VIVEQLESRSAPSDFDFIGLALTSGVGSQAYNIATEVKADVQANVLLWDAFNDWYEEQVEGYFNRLPDQDY